MDPDVHGQKQGLCSFLPTNIQWDMFSTFPSGYPFLWGVEKLEALQVRSPNSKSSAAFLFASSLKALMLVSSSSWRLPDLLPDCLWRLPHPQSSHWGWLEVASSEALPVSFKLDPYLGESFLVHMIHHYYFTVKGNW